MLECEKVCGVQENLTLQKKRGKQGKTNTSSTLQQKLWPTGGGEMGLIAVLIQMVVKNKPKKVPFCGAPVLTFVFAQTPLVNGLQQCLCRRILGKQPYIYIYICCGVIIWSKFGGFKCYYLVQVCFL